MVSAPEVRWNNIINGLHWQTYLGAVIEPKGLFASLANLFFPPRIWRPDRGGGQP
jgi:hypothetical protein